MVLFTCKPIRTYEIVMNNTKLIEKYSAVLRHVDCAVIDKIKDCLGFN